MPRKRRTAEQETGAVPDLSRLEGVAQDGRTWEADFRALPKPMTQSGTHTLGLVVVRDGGPVLGHSQVEAGPRLATSPPCSPERWFGP